MFTSAKKLYDIQEITRVNFKYNSCYAYGLPTILFNILSTYSEANALFHINNILHT